MYKEESTFEMSGASLSDGLQGHLEQLQTASPSRRQMKRKREDYECIQEKKPHLEDYERS